MGKGRVVDGLELAPPQALFPLPSVFNAAYSYTGPQDGQRFLMSAPLSRRGQEPMTVIGNPSAPLKH
jgi:hypothetical protein